jgi:endonuclease YncB( thermonuclease family)
MTDPRLETATYKDCKTFVPQFTTGKIVKCYDGDSVTIATIYNDELVRFSVRMLGYDTAEMRSKDETEKRVAKEAQQDIFNKIMGKMVTVIRNDGFDKYGRLLLELELEGESVNAYMKNKWGVSYYGGHKEDVDWGTFPKLVDI